MVNRYFHFPNKPSDEFLESYFYVCKLIVEIWQPKKWDILLEKEQLEYLSSELKCVYLSQNFLKKLIEYFNSGKTTVLYEFISVALQDTVPHSMLFEIL